MENKLCGKRIAFCNLGCKVNAYETEAMLGLLTDAGARLVAFTEEADIYIVNTCTVTNVADAKSRKMLHRARQKNPAAFVVAVGCYAQAAGAALRQDNTADAVIGTQQKSRIVELLNELLSNKEVMESVLPDTTKAVPYEPLSLTAVTGQTRAYIKVQDGCNQFCSYCIIPYVRGRVRSRAWTEVLAEVERLAEAGLREIVLTGIHLSSYGTEAGFVPDMDGIDGEPLLSLVLRLCGVSGIERLRFGSLEPRVISERFVRALAQEKKICPHFHLSLQSGCDETLRRMNRRYTTAEFAEKCALLREAFSHPALMTDVIAGFPGETEEEFAQTEQFLAQLGFAKLHVFPYSKRKGTRAEQMEGQLPEQVKAERVHRLLALDTRLRTAYQEYFVGREEVMLTEEPLYLDGKRYMAGYNERYQRMAVLCTAAQEPENNTLVRALVTGLHPSGQLLCTAGGVQVL